MNPRVKVSMKANLLALLMFVAEVNALDTKRPRHAHESMVALSQTDTDDSRAILDRFGLTIETRPDPEVGRRVTGMTPAIWRAVEERLLEPRGDVLVLTKYGKAQGRRIADSFTAEQREVLAAVTRGWSAAPPLTVSATKAEVTERIAMEHGYIPMDKCMCRGWNSSAQPDFVQHIVEATLQDAHERILAAGKSDDFLRAAEVVTGA